MFGMMWKNFKRSWVQHTGMQLATLTVLVGTFSVMCFVLAVSVNMQRILTYWGESLQMTVYLDEKTTEADIETLQRKFHDMKEFREVSFVSKEKATSLFKEHMAAYAPDLLDDQDFTNPFPASFRLSLSKAMQETQDTATLERVAKEVGALSGVEDVSYGQGWVQNYSSFVAGISSIGWIIMTVLLSGSLFVIGNSVRASIASRRDEIEILELVGATSLMIRSPFIFEGAVMGGLAGVLALLVNYGVYLAGLRAASSSLAFLKISTQFIFLEAGLMTLFVLGASAAGAFGALVTVRRLNTGWAASQRVEA